MKDFRLKYIGDEWEFFPENEKREKMDYQRLVTKIERREKMISKILVELEKYKETLNEWKKLRTIGYKKMVKYHKVFSPSYSIWLNTTVKRSKYNIDSITARNSSWEGLIKYGTFEKYICYGSIKKIGEKLDLIENKGVYYSNLKPSKDVEHKKIILNKLKEYFIPYLNDRITQFVRKGTPDFFSKEYKLNGDKILQKIYTQTPHYSPPPPPKPKVRGGTLSPMNVRNKNY